MMAASSAACSAQWQPLSTPRALAWRPGVAWLAAQRRWGRAATQQQQRSSYGIFVWSSSSGSSSVEAPEMVTHIRSGKQLPVPPELAAELAPLAAQCGITDPAALNVLPREVAKHGPPRARGLVENGQQVAALLQQLGIQREQLGRLLLRCPVLFSWPAEQRAAVLLEQLMVRLGLTVEQAGRCFEQKPSAANCVSLEPAIEELTALFAAANNGKAGQRQLGQLLQGQPTAIELLGMPVDKQQAQINNLQQRYGLSPAQLVAALKKNWAVLQEPPARLAAKEEMLQGVLDRDGRQLVGTMLVSAPKAITCSKETLQQRAQALVEVFDRERLLGVLDGSLTRMLGVNTATWQLALAVWRQYGVPDPTALALKSMQMAALNWLDQGRLANLLALQHCLQLPPADVVQQFAVYVAGPSSKRIVGRLLFLEQQGQLSRLAAHRRQASKLAPGEPPLISLCDVANKSHAAFCALPAMGGCAQHWEGSKVASTSTRACYDEFMAELGSYQPYLDALAAGEEQRQWLLSHPEVARLEQRRVAGVAAEEAAEGAGAEDELLP